MSFQRLVELSRGGHPVVRVVVFVLLAFVGAWRFQTLNTVLQESLLAGFVLGTLSFFGVVALAWLFTHYGERRPFFSLGLWSDNFIRDWGRGFMAGGLMMAMTVAVLAALGQLTLAGYASGWRFFVPGPFLLFFAAYGLADEVANRGGLLPTVMAGNRPLVAVFLASLCFAVFHGMTPRVSLLGVLNLFVMGVFLAHYLIFTGNVWGGLGWQTAWHWLAGSLLGLPVLGVELPGYLIDLSAAGPAWLTGGSFGPAGGLVGTVVLLAGVGYFAVRQPVVERTWKIHDLSLRASGRGGIHK